MVIVEVSQEMTFVLFSFDLDVQVENSVEIVVFDEVLIEDLDFVGNEILVVFDELVKDIVVDDD
jgi:hypothetical protein